MTDWKYDIDLSDVFHNDAMTFPERRDAIVDRLRRSRWVKRLEEFDDVHDMIDELGDAPDAKEFDELWGGLYDCFNADKVWVATRPELVS